MTIQRGRDLLVKLDPAGDGNFQTVLGLRSRSISFQTRDIDVTHAESPGRWRALLEGAGVRQATIAGSGLFTTPVASRMVQTIFFAESVRPWEIVIPELGTVQAPFLMTSLEYAGSYQTEMTYDIVLASAGEVLFRPQSLASSTKGSPR